MKKLLTAFILMFSLLIGLLSFSGCTQEDTMGYVTRGQWVAMLSEKFGLDTYHSNTPHYSDVTASDELFSAVQSAVEWGILSVYSKNTLDIDKLVTRQEVANTAAIAAGFNAPEDSQAAVKYAIANSIIQSSKNLQGHMTQEECVAAVEAAQSVYLNDPGEEKMVVVPNKDIVDLRSISGDNITASETEITFSSAVSGEVTQDAAGNSVATIYSGNGIVRVQAGTVLVTTSSPQHPMGIAYKITAIASVNGETVVTTESPTLADLYEELDVHTTVSANPDYIIWANGVSAVAASANGLSSAGTDEYSIQLLSHQDDSPKAVYLGQNTYSTSMSRDFTFQEGEHQKTWTGNNSGVLGSDANAAAFENTNFVHTDTPSIEDFNGSKDSWTKSLDNENKFSAGYKITGNISINSLSITTDVEYHKADLLLWEVDTPIPEAASLQISSDISATLKLEGNLNEQLKIATIPIPIVATGLVVSVDLYLYVDASGALQVQAALNYNAKAEWQSGVQLKRTQRSTTKADLELAVDIDFGGDLAASLGAFGLDIMDVGAKVGGNLSASAYVEGKCEEDAKDGVTTLNYQESIHTKADLYAPIVTLYAGSSGTLLGDLGVGGSWEVVGKGNGAACFPLVDNDWGFWNKTVTLDENGEVIIPEVVLTNTYTTKAGRTTDFAYPSFSFDYPDSWNVTEENVIEQSQTVTLTNDRGASVEYFYLGIKNPGGLGWLMRQKNILKAANSNFFPSYSYVQDSNYSDLGEFMVAKVKTVGEMYLREESEYTPIDGGTVYAVLPETYIGEYDARGADMLALSFWYGGNVSLIAHPPRNGGEFTEQEVQEVMAILTSFRISSSKDLGIDFSALAGTYIPYFEMEYEGASNLTLFEDGSIIGTTKYGNGDAYPLTSSGEKPLSVVMNEDGSYTCILSWQKDFPSPGDLAHTEYRILPPNVPSFFWMSTEPDLNDGKTRIYYNHSGGGVNGILYYKADE